MKFYLISDNTDTEAGMRLAGIEGVVVHKPEEIAAALDTAAADKDIAVILMTEKLVELCAEKVAEMKMSPGGPLVVTIPDRHGDSHITETISKYIKEAIGISL